MQNMTESGSKGKAKGALDAAEEKFQEAFGHKHDEEDEDESRASRRRPASRRRSAEEGSDEQA
jgi:hypothetical protein